eukprot:TRINITY_DN26948_c0_g1_i1.p1 TRINITY_DN26948_c0_g1~~TRINITY_DN26948_c0_g1_i1.p1  ORF type:complete len:1085 (-),score=268.37 TRINITY_DN26948_c0_g1_i1:175-3339(-)
MTDCLEVLAPASMEDLSAMSAKFEVRINSLAGRFAVFQADESWRIRDLKAAIEEDKKVPALEQRLVLSLKELRDDYQLLVDLLEQGKPLECLLLRRTADQARWLQLASEDWPKLLEEEAAWEDKDIVLDVVSRCGQALQHASEDLRDDCMVVMAAVSQNGMALQYASDEVAADRDVALAAIKNQGRALVCVAEELQEDRDFLLEAIRLNGHALSHAAPKFRSDDELLRLAVEHCGPALTDVAGNMTFLGGDADFVMRSVLSAEDRGEDRQGVRGRLSSKMSSDGRAKKSVYYFSAGSAEGDVGMKHALSPEGAQLCEMANLGLPIPPGFCITKDFPDGDANELKQAVSEVERLAGKNYGSLNEPLLLSVKGDDGAFDLSNLGLNDIIAEAWAANSEQPRMVWDSYRRLIPEYARLVKDMSKEPFEAEMQKIRDRLDSIDQLGRKHEDCHIPLRDLKNLVELFQCIYEEESGEAFPQDPHVQLEEALKALRTKAPEQAAVVQTMVLGNSLPTGGAGTFSLRKIEDESSNHWMLNAQTHDVKAGQRCKQRLTRRASKDWATENQTPEEVRATDYPSLEECMPSVFASLANCQDILCKQLTDAQAVDFVVEGGKLWLTNVHILKLQVHQEDGFQKAEEELSDSCPKALSTFLDSDTTMSEAEADSSNEESCFSDVAEEEPLPIMVDEPAEPMQAEELKEDSEYVLFVPATRGKSHVELVLRAGRAGMSFNRALSMLRRKQASTEAATAAVDAEQLPVPAKPFLKLPLWQTVMAGGLAAFGARTVGATTPTIAASMRAAMSTSGATAALRAAAGFGPALAGNLVACLPAFPAGAVCCSMYVNLLSRTSKDGSLEHVAPAQRFGCAFTAASVACAATHPINVARAQQLASASAAGANSAVTAESFASSLMKTVASGRAGMYRGIGPALLAFAPITAIEMTTIDLVLSKMRGDTGWRQTTTPMQLFVAGATAGAIAQTMVQCKNHLPTALKLAHTPVQLIPAGGPPTAAGLMTAVAAARPNTAACKEVATAYIKHMPAVATNSLVRVGLVGYFLTHAGER